MAVADEGTTLIEDIQAFYHDYYRDDILELAGKYPNESRSLFVDWKDIVRFDDELADRWVTEPSEVREYFEEALRLYDLPIDVKLEQARVRVHNLNSAHVYRPSELRKDHGGMYVGITGQLERITTPDDKPVTVAFECQRCGTVMDIKQDGDERKDPHECVGCERQGPFEPLLDESEWENYSKVRIKTPPDKSGDVGQDQIDGYVVGDLVDYGHEAGLIGRAGDRATVYGVVERVPKDQNSLLYERVLRVEAIEFVDDDGDVDIAEHREEFEGLAERDGAIELFAESLVPELYATPEWEAALELGVAYLFAAPRIDIPGGPTIRGDIHGLILSDYGMAKSTFNNAIELYSPQCIKKSVTGLSSDVGLLAAAVRDDFSGDQWTIKPGILVKGNGGHVILDEIDKTDADLSRMNDALEGNQMVDVDKAGQSVTYESRVGLLATGNPKDSRFDKYTPVADQIGINRSLLSRFDGIVTMKDIPDSEQDKEIARTIGEAYSEAQEYEFGDREEFEHLDREVDVDVGRAWIAHARENVNPSFRSEWVEDLMDWYAEEVRKLNDSFAEEGGEGEDMPVPATPRVVENTIRFSVAFARLHLRDEVAKQDVERAKSLARMLVGQTFDPDRGFGPHESRRSKTQEDRVDTLKKIIDEQQGVEEHAPLEDVLDAAEEAGIERSKAEREIDSLKQKGELYEPETNKLRTT